MPKRRVKRFEHLERPRPERDRAPAARDARPRTADRFEGVGRPAEPASPPDGRSGAALDRFGAGRGPALDAATREAYEALAREVGDEERRRLRRDGIGGGSDLAGLLWRGLSALFRARPRR